MCTFMLITYINYNLFCFLENNNSLDVKSDVNMFVLQFFFRARVIVHLDLFAKSWDCHKISSAKKKSILYSTRTSQFSARTSKRKCRRTKMLGTKIADSVTFFFSISKLPTPANFGKKYKTFSLFSVTIAIYIQGCFWLI